MKRIRFILLMSSLLLFSCFGNEFEREQITGNYYLTTTDNYNKDVYIDYELENGDFLGVIPFMVFSIGFDEKYIITKQHAFDSSPRVDSVKINYYIIPIYHSTLSPEKGVLGPLTSREFELKRVELGISNIKFRRNIK